MRPIKIQTVDASGGAKTAAFKVDTNRNPINIGLFAKVTGTVTYTIQHTYDQIPGDKTEAQINWIDNASAVAQTANKELAYVNPVSAIRINHTAGTGTVELFCVQAGNGSGGN